MSLLSNINLPADLRKLSKDQLRSVSDELRQYVIDIVSVNGGHFGASLGVVELTVALHYVFNTPHDQLVWDVGHQAYGHKIITGRKDQFHTNRKYNGISGFPKRKESEYDTFGVGHSSTSISAALGMAIASKHNGDKDKHHIAVIGDGALTGGMAFEALNHAGISNTNLLVVLNDNCMSIDPNVGGLKNYLTDLTTSKKYNNFRDDVWNFLGGISKFGFNAQELASKVEGATKAFFLKQSNLFESLGFRYFGPIDGHNVEHLTKLLEDLKNIPGPKLLHCITTKGKGYALAEVDQTLWHAPGLFDKVTGQLQVKKNDAPQPPKYQDVFGHTIIELATLNKKIMGVTPAMPSGSSLKLMMDAMPDRAFDVGIAEQHAVTFSAGLATQGLVPFCNIYSTFMQRAYDQVVHDVAIQNLQVVFCLDRGGLVGEDGPTHHGVLDIAYMRCVPNMVVCAPMNEQELRNMMYTAQLPHSNYPTSIRYPRGNGVLIDWKTPFDELKIGKGRCVIKGNKIALLSFGTVGNFAKAAIQILNIDNITPSLYDMRYAKPIDVGLVLEIAKNYDHIITIEDGCLQGGFGSAVLECMSDNGLRNPITRLGIPDHYIEHGTPAELYAECGFDTTGIINTIKTLLN